MSQSSSSRCIHAHTKDAKGQYLLSFRTRICDSQCAFLSWKILNTIVYISCITGPSLPSSNSTSDPKLRVILLVPQQFEPSSVILSTYKISYDKLQNNCDTSGYPNENHNECQDVKSYHGVTAKHTTCSTKCPNESKKTKNHLIKKPKTNTTSKH
jgi:hypothetical protein